MNPTPDSANAIVVAGASSRRGLVDERWTEIAVIWTPGKHKPWTVEILGKSNISGDDEKRYVRSGGRLEAVLDRIDDSFMGVAVKADARDWLRDNADLVFAGKAQKPRKVEVMKTREGRLMVGYSNETEAGGFTVIGDITDQVATLMEGEKS